MNVLLDRVLPLRATRSSRVKFGLGLWLIGLLTILILLACYHHGTAEQTHLARIWLMMYSLLLIMVWLIFPAGSLLLALDSHRLRIPGGVWAAFSELPWFAVICMLPAIVAFRYAGISIWMSFLACGCAIIVGLIMSWIPRWIFSICCLAPSILNALRLGHPLHRYSDAVVVAWLGGALLILLSCAIALIQYYLRRGMPETGFNSPMIVLSRNWSSNWSAIGSKQQLVQMAPWLLPQSNLRRSGPANPVYSLRILLGGCFTPMRWTYYLKICGFVAIYPLLLLLFGWLSHQRLPLAVDPDFFRGVMYGLVFGTFPILAIVSPAQQFLILHRRWARGSNDLALMALLPYLGETRTRQRSLLQTLLWARPAWLMATALLIDLLVLLIWPAYASVSALSMLCLLTGYAAGIAAMLATISHAPKRRPYWKWLSAFGMVVLISLGYGVPMTLAATQSVQDRMNWIYPLITVDVLVQLLAIGVLTLLALCSWRRFKTLPQPFLSH